MERRGPSHLGPYGQACMSCFKSKCKCIAHPDGPGCQRCHRLERVCRPSDPARRQTTRRKDSDARIAQLEKKVDSLISRLESRGVLDTIDGGRASTSRIQRNDAGQIAQAPGLETLVPSPGAFTVDNEQTESQLESQLEPQIEPRLEPQPEPQLGLEPQPPREDETTETLISTFRSRMLPHFPFVYLPTELAAHQLAAQRPLLLRAIVCVSSQSRKDSQSRELRRAMSESLLENETDRMDLLLALLTYLSWGWDHSIIMPRLMLQAISLACEIRSYSVSGGIDAPEIRALFLPGIDAADESSATQGNFLEQHRAVLGCFVLSSAVSTYLNYTIDALRWTPQMGEGLAALAASRECPTDAAFAVQIRLQLLAQKSVHIRHQQQTEQFVHMQDTAGTMPIGPDATALMSLVTLREELQTLRESLPATGTDSARHLSHIWATELAISQTRYAVGSVVPFIISHFSALTTSSGTPKNGERAGYLSQCVDAAVASIEALLALSAPDFAGTSLIQWTQLAGGLVVLYHLTTGTEDPLWDRAAVRTAVNMPRLLDRIAEKLDLAAAVVAAERQEPQDIFTGLGRRIRGFCVVLRDGSATPVHKSQWRLDSNARDLWHIPVSSYSA